MNGRATRGARLIFRQLFLVFLTSACCLTAVRVKILPPILWRRRWQILRATNSRCPDMRQQYLKQEIEQIHGIVELRQVLGLQEWRDQETTSGVATVDQTFRGRLCQRFEQEIRMVLRQGDSTSRTVVLNMLAEQPPVLAIPRTRMDWLDASHPIC